MKTPIRRTAPWIAAAGMAVALTGPASAAPVSASATLSGSAVVPGPGDPAGSGTLTVTFDAATNEFCYDYRVSLGGDAGNITTVTINRGGAGRNGDPVAFIAGNQNTPSAEVAACGFVSDERQPSPADAAAVVNMPEGYYALVTSTNYPDGALRGQLRGAVSRLPNSATAPTGVTPQVPIAGVALLGLAMLLVGRVAPDRSV
jgi:hypothetical protein